jgi:hypothetical protein
MEKSEPLLDIEDNLPSEHHALRGEHRSLQVCGVNKIWICRGMFLDYCVFNSPRLDDLLTRTNSERGRCECNTDIGHECCQNSDCGDPRFETCDTFERTCQDLPCNAATQGPEVECCVPSDCEDVRFETCNTSTKKCVDLPCNASTQGPEVECCSTADCGDARFVTCNTSTKKCADLDCDASTQGPEVECCGPEDCERLETCFDNTCVLNPAFCVPGGSIECCEDSDCLATQECTSSGVCVLRSCNTNNPNTECCSNSQCAAGQSCSSSVCVIEGTTRATLIWNGDGKYMHCISPCWDKNSTVCFSRLLLHLNNR